jgi:hypothetical protein
MALETLKGVKKIGMFDVVVMDELREKFPDKFNPSGGMDYKWFEAEIRPKNHIYVRHDVNSISFTIQNGPVKEAGCNGCQVDTLIEAAKIMIDGLNKKHPSVFNERAIADLDCALKNLSDRRDDRVRRGVEGTSQA